MQFLRGTKNAGVSVTSADTELLEFAVKEADGASILVKNTGANPLTGFSVYGRVNPDAPYSLLSSSGFTSVDTFTDGATTDPTVLAAGAEATVLIAVGNVEAIKVFAKSALGTTVDAHVGSYGELLPLK